MQSFSSRLKWTNLTYLSWGSDAFWICFDYIQFVITTAMPLWCPQKNIYRLIPTKFQILLPRTSVCQDVNKHTKLLNRKVILPNQMMTFFRWPWDMALKASHTFSMMMTWDEILIANNKIQNFLSLDKYRTIYVSVNIKIASSLLTERQNSTIWN